MLTSVYVVCSMFSAAIKSHCNMTEQDCDVLSYVIFLLLYWRQTRIVSMWCPQSRIDSKVFLILVRKPLYRRAPLIACESVFRDTGGFIPFIVYSVLSLEIKFDWFAYYHFIKSRISYFWEGSICKLSSPMPLVWRSSTLKPYRTSHATVPCVRALGARAVARSRVQPNPTFQDGGQRFAPLHRRVRSHVYKTHLNSSNGTLIA